MLSIAQSKEQNHHPWQKIWDETPYVHAQDHQDETVEEGEEEKEERKEQNVLEAMAQFERRRIGNQIFQNLIHGSSPSALFQETKQKDSLHQLTTKIQSTITILNDSQSAHDIVQEFKGRLCHLNPDFLNQVRERGPDSFSARVADTHENLSFDMQRGRGLQPLLLQNETEEESVFTNLVNEFEHTLKKILYQDDNDDSAIIEKRLEYQSSFLRTEHTIPQPAHVDFPWEVLERDGNDLFIAVFPLTSEGMFLQLWKDHDHDHNDTIQKTNEKKQVYGKVVYIPFGKMLIVPASTIHGGGFKSGHGGNLRFHLYLARGDVSLPRFQNNKYTERLDRGREMCERFLDTPNLMELVGVILDED